MRECNCSAPLFPQFALPRFVVSAFSKRQLSPSPLPSAAYRTADTQCNPTAQPTATAHRRRLRPDSATRQTQRAHHSAPARTVPHLHRTASTHPLRRSHSAEASISATPRTLHPHHPACRPPPVPLSGIYSPYGGLPASPPMAPRPSGVYSVPSSFHPGYPPAPGSGMSQPGAYPGAYPSPAAPAPPRPGDPNYRY